MKRTLGTLIVFLVLTGIMSSCRLFNPSVMLRTKRNYPYQTAQDTVPGLYVLQKGDWVTVRLFANEGFKIIDLTTTEDGTRTQLNITAQNSFVYLIEPDSMMNLPIIGRVKMGGMNTREAEMYLEEQYRNYFIDPYVMIQIRNRRAIVFPGTSGSAQVITLENDYVTLVEALAMAGGIGNGGKAYKVKVFRGSMKNPSVYKINMSTAEGMAEAKMYYIRANDIVYVEPSYFAGRQILSTTAQIISLVSSTILTTLLTLSVTN